jgi:CheY-like chemotaxis protein
MRVMILEDDPWIADLLKQIVLSLRPGIHVACLGNVADALLDWQQHAADLVIADWNLPDDPGTLLLERIRRDNRQVPLVMITGRADRNSVMAIRPLGISAFISKPFQVPKVLECLERLLPPADDSPVAETGTSASLSDYLAELPAKDLDLPVQPGMLDDLRPAPAVPPSLRGLGERWQFDPALTARLVAAANGSQYNSAGTPCLSLSAALRTLGPATSLNIGLGLRPSTELQDAELQRQALAHMQQVERLSQRLGELAARCQIDPAPLQTAAALHRIGELCVLHHAQLWQNAGNTLDAEQLSQALDELSTALANRLKAHWRLPVPLRELIGACSVLPSNNVKRETLLMRLAASELDANPGSNEQARLRRLAGLS